MEQTFEETLQNILWYNSYIERGSYDDAVSEMIKIIWQYKQKGEFVPWDAFGTIKKEFLDWHTEEHAIWMMLAGSFGDWGTSIRSAWISDFDGCIMYLIWCKAQCEPNYDDEMLENYTKEWLELLKNFEKIKN